MGRRFRQQLMGSPIVLHCVGCGKRLTVLHFCHGCRGPLCGSCRCCPCGAVVRVSSRCAKGDEHE